MQNGQGRVLLVLLCLTASLSLGAKPTAMGSTQRAQTDTEGHAIVAAWTLPGLIYERGGQIIEQCVRAAFEVSRWNPTPTGTLSYSSTGEVSYRASPDDVLVVEFADGSVVEFELLEMQGHFEDGADGFLVDDYTFACRGTADQWADLTVQAQQTGDSFFTRTLDATASGTVTFGDSGYQVDAQATSTIYFESSFGGSEYRNETILRGNVTAPGFTLALNDTFFFQLVTSGNESASANNRSTRGQWQTTSGTYTFRDAGTTRSFYNGKPSRTDTEWRAGGTIWHNNRSWATISGRYSNDVFEVWASLPDGQIALEPTAHTASASSTPSVDQAPRNVQIEDGKSPLELDEEGRMRLALDLYRQIGLSEEAAMGLIMATGVSDEAMLVLLIVASRSYSLDHQYQVVLDLLEPTLGSLQGREELGEFAAALLTEVGKSYYQLGNWETALDRFDDALAHYETAGNAEQQAVVLANMAVILEGWGQVEEALAANLDALETFEALQARTGDEESRSQAQELETVRLPFNLGTTYNNVGLLYHRLGEEDKAEQAFQEALKYHAKTRAFGGLAATWQNLGRLYADIGRYDAAFEALASGQDAADKLGDPLAQAHILSTIAYVYEAQQEFDKALLQYEEALQLLQTVDNPTHAAATLANMAVVHIWLKDFARAEELLAEALSLFTELGSRVDQATVLSNLGYIQERQDNLEEALDLYRQAIEVIESIQGEFHVDEVKSAFLANQSDLYAHLVNLLWQQREWAEAFDYAERARARAFLDLVSNSQVDLSQHADAELLQQAEELRLHLLHLEQARAIEQAKSPDEFSQSYLDELNAELDVARRQYTRLLTRLKLSSSEYAAIQQAEIVSLGEVQETILEEGTTLIDYFVLNDRVLVWVVDAEEYEVVTLEITRDELTSQVEFLHGLLSEQLFDQDVADSLYRSLFAPLTPHIDHTNLLIVPHGILHYLPFASLRDAESGRFLVQEYSLTSVPSASALKFILAKRQPNQGRLLAMGNPDRSLPNAGAEANAVARLYDTEALVGEQASETQLRTQAAQIDILHLAAHGTYDPVHPLYTRIALAADESNDGNVEVHEVYGLDLREANLVVLSACETALGEQSTGDEIVGLTRAFLYAGTPSVVTTLWRVDDAATSELMQSFYQHLQAGHTTAEALQAAQLAIMAEERWNEPYYWAAFTLTGDYLGRGQSLRDR